MTHDLRWSQVAEQLYARYPKFAIVEKETSKLMRLLGWLLTPINPTFMADYTTTIGYKVYMPRRLHKTTGGTAILDHEAVHIRQYDSWRWLFYFGYLFCLPALFTLRAKWEFEAYRTNLANEQRRAGWISDGYIGRLVDEFVGPSYLFMSVGRKRMRRKFERVRKEIEGK